MTNLEKFIKKNTSSISGETFNWSNEAISNQILDLAKALNKDLKLINKPVETTNEQPKKKTFYYTTCRECGGKCKAPNEICNKCFKEWGGQ